MKALGFLADVSATALAVLSMIALMLAIPAPVNAATTGMNLQEAMAASHLCLVLAIALCLFRTRQARPKLAVRRTRV